MTDVALAEVAETLFAAYDTRVPVEPPAAKYQGLTLADAYEIQLLQIRRRLEAGARIKGHKVGLSSPAMQRQLGVDQPDYGHLLDDMFWLENAPVPASRFLQPRVEPEIAFVLKRPLAGPGVTVAEAAAAVDFVLPALELIDSRIRDWQIGIIDTIADNASSGGVVLGSSPPRSPTWTCGSRDAPCTATLNSWGPARVARCSGPPDLAGVAGQHCRRPRRGAGGGTRSTARLHHRVRARRRR